MAMGGENQKERKKWENEKKKRGFFSFSFHDWKKIHSAHENVVFSLSHFYIENERERKRKGVRRGEREGKQEREMEGRLRKGKFSSIQFVRWTNLENQLFFSDFFFLWIFPTFREPTKYRTSLFSSFVRATTTTSVSSPFLLPLHR